MRRRRILFAGFVARMDVTRLPKCLMFVEIMGVAGRVGGQEKEWMGCFLEDLKAFGINADQWTIASQDEGEWRKTAEQGTEHFMENWIAAEKHSCGELPGCDAKAVLTETADVHKENARLQELVAELRTASPSVARVADLAVMKEREAFEKKFRRALFLLRKKDTKIRELSDAVARQRRPARERRGARPGDRGRGPGGKDPGGGDGEINKDQASVIKQLEACVEDQAEQIETLVEEVVRLRSSRGIRLIGRDEDDSRAEHGCRGGSVRAQPPVEDQEDESSKREERLCSEPEDSPQDERICLGERSKEIVERLHEQVAQLEAALSAQTSVLAEKDAELKRAAGYYRRAVEQLHERETRLRERIETVERLLATARHTVLDREERLRQAETARRVSAGNLASARSTPDCANGGDRDDRRGQTIGAAAVVAAREGVRDEPMGTPGNTSKATSERQPTSAPTTEKKSQELVRVEEWWFHVVAALRKCERDRTSNHKVYAAKASSGGDQGGKEVRRLRKLLQEQALEVVALRQTVLRMEITVRANACEEETRANEFEERAATAECLLKTEKSAGEALEAELETRAALLLERGDLQSALLEAREELSVMKLAVIRARGEAELRTRLLEDEKKRFVLVLSRAEDLQGDLDRLAVEGTLKGIPGDVGALALIEHFAGRLLKQFRRMKNLEAEVRDLRTRCARLACLARRDPADADPAHGAQTGSGDRDTQKEECGDWVEIGVHEAKAAMEAERRRALEHEIKSLRNDVLVAQQRANAARRDAADDSRLRRLVVNASISQNVDGNVDDADSLRRKLTLASSEIEALRVHAADLRRRTRSGCWSWSSNDTNKADDGGDCRGGESGRRGHTFPLDYAPGAQAAVSALQEFGMVGDRNNCAGYGGSDAGASAEIARLASILEERNSQVGVLSSTIEAFRSSSSFSLSSKRRGGGGGGDDGDGSMASPRLRSFRSSRKSSPVFWPEVSPDVDSGVDILNQISAQGLARHCVALTVRVTSTIARAGAAERRADMLAVEVEQKERKARAAEVIEADLERRNRALGDRLRKTLAALNSLTVESAARLEEAGEEASKLRSALRDAEVETNDAWRRLELVRVDGAALATELHKSRERHREEMSSLSDEQSARLKECADRFFADATSQSSCGRDFVVKGSREGERAVARMTVAVAVSPVVSAINNLVKQWHAHAKRGYPEPHQYEKSEYSSSGGRVCGDQAGGKQVSRGYDTFHDRRELVSRFLQETAVRIEAECSGAIRHARALEWELRGARRHAIDTAMVLDEAKVECARLSARAAAAEAALVSTSSVIPPGIKNDNYFVDLHTNARSADETSGRGLENFKLYLGRGDTFAVAGDGGEKRGGYNGSSTTAVVSLLEKRLAVAVEDLVSCAAARRAAEAGEAAATARVEAAEAEAMSARAAVDVMSAELERHKLEAEDRMIVEAAEWRREIREEIGRWWRDDLMNLHGGVSLDWGSVGLAEGGASAWNTPDTAPTLSCTRAYRDRKGGDHHPHCLGGDDLSVGVTGEESMAQALVAGRAEQAMLKERLVARERCLGRVREEATRLRGVLERWYREFVPPATEMRRRRLVETRQQEETRVEDERGRLEEQLLAAATADLLGAREEATGLRREALALKALVARLKDDEDEARKAVARRIKSASEIVRRRADGDLRDAADRLAEERERFKSQLGAAHADILRLGTEAVHLERRNQELELAVGTATGSWRGEAGGTGLNLGTAEKKHPLEDGRDCQADDPRGRTSEVVVAAAVAEDAKRERSLQEEAEEREAMQRMCNSLALDLKVAVGARAEAEDAREVLVKVAAESKAETQVELLARENLEAAVKELGHLLQFVREPGGEARDSDEDDGNRLLEATSLSGWDRSKKVTRRFARVVVAAKVAEADLSRRLRGAAVIEADLRHTIRRQNIRIEEFKREQATADRLARSSAAGAPWSTPINSRRLEQGYRNTVACDTGGKSVYLLSDGTRISDGSGNRKKEATERTAKEIAQAAAIRRLELEIDLAEATARGEVGDAAIRAADMLALRLFPEVESGVGPGEGGGGCLLCGRPFLLKERPKSGAGTRDRGVSFLMPSAEVESKAATAAMAAREADAKAKAKVNGGAAGVVDAAAALRKLPVIDRDGATDITPFAPDAGDGDGGSGTETYAGHRPMALPDDDARRPRENPQAGEGRTGPRLSPARLTGCVLSLEEQLTRLETDAGWGPSAILNSAGGRNGPNLQEVRTCQDGLEKEALRLREELVRQRRSYLKAMTMIKGRYENPLDGCGAARRPPRAPTGCTCASDDGGDPGHGVEGAGAVGTDGTDNEREDRSSVDVTRLRGGKSDSDGPEQGQFLLRESLRYAEEALRSAKSELEEVRELHAKEALEAKVKLARAIDAHEARVGTLEEQLRRARKKVRNMARPKPPIRAVGRAREHVASTSDNGGCGPALPLSTSPLSSYELLNMLAAADEELFKTKEIEQRLAYELHAKAAEADALRASALIVSGVTNAANFPENPLAAIVSSARLTSAEAEVERLRNEALVARKEAIEAQREASAVRLMTRRMTTIRAGGGRSREKELRRQVAAYRREVEKLRSTVGLVATTCTYKEGYTRREEAEAVVKPAEDLPVVLSKTQAQLSSSREESERRRRTVVALRAAKTSFAIEIDQLRREAAGLKTRLDRALKDGVAKGSAVKALRAKIGTLEATRNPQTSEHGSKPMDASERSTGYAAGAGSLSLDSQDGLIRELTAERNRLRKNMRARQGSLSKQAAEIDARVAELERLEGEAVALRAAVTRKDDAYRNTKKKLATLHEEHEILKASSHRWKADAEAKLSTLKRASDAAIGEARTCRKRGEAAERELAALKSAFRSFLKTLWEDLRYRLPYVDPVAQSRERGGAETSPNREREASRSFDGSPPGNSVGAPRMASEIRVDVHNGEEEQVIGVNGSAPRVAPSARTDTFTELTEAEVSDIMQALGGTELDSVTSSFLPTTAVVEAPPASSNPGESALALAPGGGHSRSVTSQSRQGSMRGTTEEVDALRGQTTWAALVSAMRSLCSKGFSSGISGTTQGKFPLSPHLPPRSPQKETTVKSRCTADGRELGSREGTDTLERWSHEVGDLLGARGTAGPVSVDFFPGEALSPLAEVRSDEAGSDLYVNLRQSLRVQDLMPS